MVILQRRLASSTYALLKSLERRKEKLEQIERLSGEVIKSEIKSIDFEEVEDLSEEERWNEEQLWETLSVAENKEELQEEIKTINNLITKAKEIIKSETEVKLLELRKTLDDLSKKQPNEKILIFTESKDTLEYLEKKIGKTWGYSVVTIHGGMKLEQRIEAEKIFKNEKQILIATEAAGEGINLQFCHLMINYDIPWNPNRLEQRMGRIHRYGQTKEVFVFNLIAKDTREGGVLTRMFEKLDEIRKSLGDKVFDVIGEVFTGKNLHQILIEAAAGAKSMEELLKEIDIKVDEEYIRKVKENLGESLATKYLDYTRIKEMAQKAREYKLIPEYTEEFFKRGFRLAGGNIKIRKDGFCSIESLPYEIKSIGEKDDFKRKYGPLVKFYPKITFDKDTAFKNPDSELVSFGHPLFEAVLKFIEIKYGNDLKRGAIFLDPEGKLDGYILFYEGEIRDGLNQIVGKRLFAIYTNRTETKPIAPMILWDLAPAKPKKEEVDISELQERVSAIARSQMEEYRKQKEEEREREAKIKEKYGIKSLEHFLITIDREIIDLDDRKRKGENVDIVIRNKEEQRRKYEESLRDLKEEIEREKTLTMGMPNFVGIVKVIPAGEVNGYMKTDPEVERIAMEESMKYERKNGREPEDVALENLGFDIRSIEKNGNKRYIEVKGRAETGSVALTQNEWFKAKRFGNDYYLYVVYNTSSKPELYIIQNPAEKLKPEEKIEIVRYIVPLKQIKENSEKNDV